MPHQSPLWELTRHEGQHSVTSHPAEVAFPPLPQQLDLATPERCKAKLTELAGYIPRWYTHPKTVSQPTRAQLS